MSFSGTSIVGGPGADGIGESYRSPGLPGRLETSRYCGENRCRRGSVDPGEVPPLPRGAAMPVLLAGAELSTERCCPVTQLSWNAEPKPGSLLPALPGNSSSNCWAAAPLWPVERPDRRRLSISPQKAGDRTWYASSFVVCSAPAPSGPRHETRR
jgi:hypothetical protein